MGPPRSKAVGRTRAFVGRSEPNIYQLLSMFGGIVDISKGHGSPHTWSLPWPRLGVLQNGYSSLVFHVIQARKCSDTFYTFFTRFWCKQCTELPLLYAREFWGQNIYLLVPMGGRQ